MSSSAFVQWLEGIKACEPAVTELSAHPTYKDAYNSLTRPDWLLWISIRQAPDMSEVRRIIGILVDHMKPSILAAASDPGATTVLTEAIATVTACGAGNPPADLRPLTVLVYRLESSVGYIDSGTPGFTARSYAISTMSRLVRICYADNPAEAAEVGIEIGNGWMQLEQYLNKLSTAQVCEELRTVLPFKGSYAPEGC
jgi:hypothetical protein